MCIRDSINAEYMGDEIKKLTTRAKAENNMVLKALICEHILLSQGIPKAEQFFFKKDHCGTVQLHTPYRHQVGPYAKPQASQGVDKNFQGQHGGKYPSSPPGQDRPSPHLLWRMHDSPGKPYDYC
eukprot:TRINITY_DN44175_c0_g1_i1.p1 TRINITY_DN44175_c0_g1~~TRINITY_DN44175_c0_g1_i1.p1  ORF type:complete len:125 (-),score=21.86 TRINITY_DN44175_c0_g1_i1:111-485(-)